MKLVPIGSPGIRVDVSKLNTFSHQELLKLKNDILTMEIEPEVRQQQSDSIVDAAELVQVITNVLNGQYEKNKSTEKVTSENEIESSVVYEPLIRELTDKVKELQTEVNQLKDMEPNKFVTDSVIEQLCETISSQLKLETSHGRIGHLMTDSNKETAIELINITLSGLSKELLKLVTVRG